MQQVTIYCSYIMLGLYLIAMLAVTLYCILQFHLLFLYKKHHRLHPTINYKKLEGDKLPFVTVQLPLYNEEYVAARIIDSACAQDYPKDCFEVMVLDDSTDKTIEICQQKVKEYKAKGYNIRYIHRVNRQGYKAGALQDAMPEVRGDFIAIFDADFLPRVDFLRTTVAHFEDEKVGTVQTRWAHLNADYSLLTQLQALQLNVHFTVEQAGRSYGGLLLQFNGTAGVWRKKAINDAGGWHSDTLTEDLDLSFRSQIKGYKILFLEKFESPAELPVDMNGLKGQQFRWNKGGAENARKLLKMIWSAENLHWLQRFHATSQLLAYGVFLWLFLAAISSIPLVLMFEHLEVSPHILSFSLLGLFSIICIYYTANVQAVLYRKKAITWGERIRFLGYFLSFLPISMGLSLYNSVAVLEGYFGKKSSFVRTPKYGITANTKKENSFRKMRYVAKSVSWITIVEGLLSIIFALCVYVGIKSDNHAFVLFHSMLSIGFGAICYYSIKHLRID